MTTTKHIDKRNTMAMIRRQSQTNEFRELSITEKMRAYPYYGYVDISIPNCQPIVMFSNNDDFVAMEYFWSREFEPVSVALWVHLSRGVPIILDIGAYSGIYSLIAASVNKGGEVFAFEPLDRAFARLVVNRNINKLVKITPMQVAVGATSSATTLHIFRAYSVLTTAASVVEGHHKSMEQRSVDMISIDDIVGCFKNRRVGLAKIDVERAELDVLCGMENTIERWMPDLIVEVLEIKLMKELWNFFKAKNYTGYIISDHDRKVFPLENTYRENKSVKYRNILFTARNEKEVKHLVRDAIMVSLNHRSKFLNMMRRAPENDTQKRELVEKSG